MPSVRHPLKERILSRIGQGEFGSAVEIAEVAGVSRQTANRWVRESLIDLGEKRAQRLAKMRDQEQRYLAGLPPRRKPSKQWLRKIADQAKQAWDERHAKPETTTTD